MEMKVDDTRDNPSYKAPKDNSVKSLLTEVYNKTFEDRSLQFLILSNLLVIFFAFIENWNILIVMWIYLFQSIIIGVFTFIRILDLKNVSNEGFPIYINGTHIKLGSGSKFFIACFFAVHYGLFHFVYAIFLLFFSFLGSIGSNSLVFESISVLDCILIFLSTFGFFLSHLFSFFYNKEKDKTTYDIKKIFSYPYARIIPMHITIIFGVMIISIFGDLGSRIALILFLSLKTLADIIMHYREHL